MTRDLIWAKRIDNAAIEGVQYLKDIRWLEKNYGVGETFSYSARYVDYEQYFTFKEDTFTTLFMGMVAVFFVILIITADITATMLVILCVLVTDLFLLGLIFYWGLTLNPLVVLNIIVALGISVDFSAHIAYAYLIQVAPPKCDTPSKIRLYKA